MGILWGLDWKWVLSKPFRCCFCWVTQDYFRPVTSFHSNSYVGHFGSIQGKTNPNSKRSCDAGLWLRILIVHFLAPYLEPEPRLSHFASATCPTRHSASWSTCPWSCAIVGGGRRREGAFWLWRGLSVMHPSYMEDVLVQGLFFWSPFVGEHLGPWITETKGSSQGNGGISSTYSLLVVIFLFASSLWGLPFFHTSSALYLKGFWLYCTLSVFTAIAGGLSGYRICLSTKTGSHFLQTVYITKCWVLCNIFHF